MTRLVYSLTLLSSSYVHTLTLRATFTARSCLAPQCHGHGAAHEGRAPRGASHLWRQIRLKNMSFSTKSGFSRSRGVSRGPCLRGRVASSTRLSPGASIFRLAAHAQLMLLSKSWTAGGLKPRCQAVHERPTSKTPRSNNVVTDCTSQGGGYNLLQV